ncbi:PREDICTED: IgGFc-binding protein-like [Galeopterus variegatus]|uniref:IgGFc-binding protein-like n=1 Tax=Galeopterus variegatus TaxID=482537 RepID=A0ABM0RDC0_GALVR|nr:PREDICTED: IgGFc-binding protein-like [Galeopterus variegatus]
MPGVPVRLVFHGQDVMVRSEGRMAHELALAAFVWACQAIDIAVGTWHIPGFCEPSCPENSHWEICADICRPSCPHEEGHVLPLGAQELSPNCHELCECNEAGQPPCCSPQACGDEAACLLPGACRYVLSRTCRTGPGVPAFTVCMDNEHLIPMASVTRAQKIKVGVHGVKVMMEAQTPRKVQVNGTQAHLPLHLASGHVHVYFRGFGAVLQTDAGLLVSYDWCHHVSIMVLETYAGALCGLGGDFNEDPQDDFCAPDGSLLPDPEAFTLSWKGPDSPARDEPAESQVHMENCMHDLCATGGSRKILCEVLGSYAQQCQHHSLPLWPWKHLMDCKLACPPHGHYELCSSSCPSSCAEPALPDSGLTPCQEGCHEIDPDPYVSSCALDLCLAGGSDRILCVALQVCATVCQGANITTGTGGILPSVVGDRVWLKRCTRCCSCDKPGHFCCSPACCPVGEISGLQSGLLDCQSPLGTCVATGDPHYFTFGGAVAHFQHTCIYHLAHSCGPDPISGGFSFSMEASNRNFCSQHVSFLNHVEVEPSSPGLKTHVILERGQQVQVDGQVVSSLVQLGPEARVWQEQDQVHFNSRNTLVMQVGPEYRGHLCASLATSVVTSATTSCQQDTRATKTCQDRPWVEQLCRVLTNRTGPFAKCHWHEDPTSYTQACVFDLCQYGMGNRMLGVTCQVNSYYNFCGPPCPATCASLNFSMP